MLKKVSKIVSAPKSYIEKPSQILLEKIVDLTLSQQEEQ